MCDVMDSVNTNIHMHKVSKDNCFFLNLNVLLKTALIDGQNCRSVTDYPQFQSHLEIQDVSRCS